jgi:pimeloyl-ACP methyl ester carboxylesterase
VVSKQPDRSHARNIEAQFGLDGGSWMQRLVARGLMLALGSATVPRQQASTDEIASLETRHVRSAQGYDIAYLEGGDAKGRTVIFVHGTPGGARGWADYLLSPPGAFRYIALDRPGFGQSGPDGAVVSLDEQARAVIEVVRAQNAGPAILVGHSYGAPVVVQAAADAPERVAAVVVLAGSLDPALEHVPFVQHLGDMWPLRKMLLRGLRNSNRELIALKPELERLVPRLGTIAKPFLIVHGTRDKLVPFANVAFMKAHLTAATNLDVIEIEGQDHFLPWNARARVEEAIAKAAAF